MSQEKWFVVIDDRETGPLSGADVRRLAAENRITPDSKIRKEGMKGFVRAAQVKGLFATMSAWRNTASERARTRPVSAGHGPPPGAGKASWADLVNPDSGFFGGRVDFGDLPPDTRVGELSEPGLLGSLFGKKLDLTLAHFSMFLDVESMRDRMLDVISKQLTASELYSLARASLEPRKRWGDVCSTLGIQWRKMGTFAYAIADKGWQMTFAAVLIRRLGGTRLVARTLADPSARSLGTQRDYTLELTPDVRAAFLEIPDVRTALQAVNEPAASASPPPIAKQAWESGTSTRKQPETDPATQFLAALERAELAQPERDPAETLGASGESGRPLVEETSAEVQGQHVAESAFCFFITPSSPANPEDFLKKSWRDLGHPLVNPFLVQDTRSLWTVADPYDFAVFAAKRLIGGIFNFDSPEVVIEATTLTDANNNRSIVLRAFDPNNTPRNSLPNNYTWKILKKGTSEPARRR